MQTKKHSNILLQNQYAVISYSSYPFFRPFELTLPRVRALRTMSKQQHSERTTFKQYRTFALTMSGTLQTMSKQQHSERTTFKQYPTVRLLLQRPAPCKTIPKHIRKPNARSKNT